MFLSLLLMWNFPTFETVSKEFETREHALNWIIENQLGRRNLNPNQIAYLRGKRYETEKKIWGGTGANQYSKEQSSQNENSAKSPKTNENLAKEYGVSGMRRRRRYREVQGQTNTIRSRVGQMTDLQKVVLVKITNNQNFHLRKTCIRV